MEETEILNLVKEYGTGLAMHKAILPNPRQCGTSNNGVICGQINTYDSAGIQKSMYLDLHDFLNPITCLP